MSLAGGKETRREAKDTEVSRERRESRESRESAQRDVEDLSSLAFLSRLLRLLRETPASFAASRVSFSRWLCIFLLSLGLTAALYWPARNAWFVSDDHQWLSALSWKQLAGFFTGTWGYGLAYRPLSRASFALDVLLFGDSPTGWHMTNFVLHAANAAWLYLLAGMFTARVSFRLLLPFLFVISPLGHENVAWVSGRTHLLGAFFLLAALYCLIRGLELESGRTRWLVGGALLYTAALASYEAAVSLPLLLGVTFFAPLASRPSRVARKWLPVAVVLMLTAAYLLLRYLALGDLVGGVNRHHADYFSGLGHNGMTVLWTLFYQLRPGRFYAVLLLAAFVVALLRTRAKGQVRSFALLFLAGSALYAPFSLVDGVAWRFLYLVQVPLLAGVCLAAWSLVEARKKVALISLILLAAAISLSVSTTHRYAGEWKEAGEIAQWIVREAAGICRGTEPGGKLVFSGVPAMHKHASVFMTSFDIALRRRCPDFSGQVWTEAEVANQAGSGEAKAREFRFDPQRGKFIEVQR